MYERLFDLSVGDGRGQLSLECLLSLEQARAVFAGESAGPVPLPRSSGRRAFDLVSGGPLILLVSSRVTRALESIGATG